MALARAFSHRPRIVFADEPTGNLDAATGATVIELLGEMNRALDTTLVLVTHDPELAARARRIIRLADGAVVADTGRRRVTGLGFVAAMARRETRGLAAAALALSWPRWPWGWRRSSPSTRSPRTCRTPCATRPARCWARTSPSRARARSRRAPTS